MIGISVKLFRAGKQPAKNILTTVNHHYLIFPTGYFERIESVSVSSSCPQWNLVCADYWKIPLQHICFMTGWTLGYILLGTLCDWCVFLRFYYTSCFLNVIKVKMESVLKFTSVLAE